MKSRKFICFLLLGIIFLSIFTISLNSNMFFSNSSYNFDSERDINIKNSSSQETFYLLDWDRYISNVYYGGVAVDSENNIYYGGTGNWDYFIAKYHENGTQLWTVQNNIIDSDWAEGVAVDSEDSVYISGYCYPGQQVTGTIVTRKYNKTGDFQWDRRLGTDGRAYDITIDNEDNVYVTGYTEEFGASGTDRDIIIIKYDRAGNLKWYRRSHVIGHDEGNSIAYNPTNGLIYITGKAHGNMLLLAYTKNGDLVLSAEWDNGGSEYGNELTINPTKGDLYIVGALGYLCVVYDSMCNNILNITGPSQKSITLDSSGNLFVSKVSTHDIILSKYSSDGDKFWELIETNYYPFSLSMDCDSQNNVYLTCTVGSLYKFAIDRIGPIVNITEPKPNEEYGQIRPDVVLEIEESNLHTIWYSLSNESLISQNYTWNGNIHTKAWEIMGNGNITINIYANDTNGNLGYNYVYVIKNTSITFYWDLNGTRIYIDDIDPNNNWLEIDKKNPWCYGSGTLDDPYIIENVFINGSGTGRCIQIKNSMKNFIIKNSTLINSGSGHTDAGIYFYNVSNGIVENSTCANNGYNGIIETQFSKNNSYFSNNLIGNKYGIYMIRSNLTSLYDNIIENNDYGIYLEGCTNQKIYNSFFLENTYRTLWVKSCSELNISCNTFDSGSNGIIIEYGEKIYINKNNITNFDYSGLYLDYTKNSTIEKNSILQNDNGIRIDYSQTHGNNIINDNLILKNQKNGIWIKSVNNLIYNNNFGENHVNALDAGANNSWDNGIIGNYWGDYVGKDTDDNGIGDHPYNITGTVGSKDNFPIWWDSPKLSIENPSNNEIFGNTSPIFTIIVEEGIVEEIFYSINSGNVTYLLPSNMSINQNIWDTVDNGTVQFHFYANDSRGYDSEVCTIILRKDIVSPIINILSPTPNQEFGTNAPNFEIFIDERNLDKIWYTIDNDNTKFYVLSISGNLDQAVWNSLNTGQILLIFYASDSAGNIGFQEVTVVKTISSPPPSSSHPGIPGYDIFYLLGILGVVSFIITKKIILEQQKTKNI